MIECREHTRIPVELRVLFSTTDQTAIRQGTMFDISAGGRAVTSTVLMSPGTGVKLLTHATDLDGNRLQRLLLPAVPFPIGSSRLTDFAPAFLHPATTLHYLHDLSSVPPTHDLGREPLASILLRALSGHRFGNLGRRGIPYSGFAAHDRNRQARASHEKRANRRLERRSGWRRIDYLSGSRSNDALVISVWLKLEALFERVIRMFVDRHPYICCWQVIANIANFQIPSAL